MYDLIAHIHFYEIDTLLKQSVALQYNPLQCGAARIIETSG
jgi:hypothetical protein